MKVQSVSSAHYRVGNIKKNNVQNLNRANISFEGKRTGMKLYGGFVGAICTISGVSIAGFSITALIISLLGAGAGSVYGAMIDRVEQVREKERQREFERIRKIKDKLNINE